WRRSTAAPGARTARRVARQGPAMQRATATRTRPQGVTAAKIRRAATDKSDAPAGNNGGAAGQAGRHRVDAGGTHAKRGSAGAYRERGGFSGHDDRTERDS